MSTVSHGDCMAAAASQLVQTYLNPSNSSKNNSALGPFLETLTLATLHSALKNSALFEEFLGSKPDPLQSIIVPIVTQSISINGPSFLSHLDSSPADVHAKADSKSIPDPRAMAKISSDAGKSAAPVRHAKSPDPVVNDTIIPKPSKRGTVASIIETRKQRREREAKEAAGLPDMVADHEALEPIELPPLIPEGLIPEGEEGEKLEEEEAEDEDIDNEYFIL